MAIDLSAMTTKKRIAKMVVLVSLTLAFTAVYFTYFKHPPPEVLLQMNNAGEDSDFGASSFVKRHDSGRGADDKDNDDEEEDGGKDGVKVVKDADFWKKFIKKNNYVAIGAVYDKCSNWENQVGTVVLVPDKETGGVKSRTFFNMTIENELEAGEFHLEVKYNGQDLYDNYWELCELEDDLPVANKTFVCPVKPGHFSRVKERSVPSYLPKGHYQAKAWAVDDDQKIFACGFADFRL